MVEMVLTVEREGLLEPLEKIKKLILFDQKLAHSRVWNADVFFNAQNDAIHECSQTLQKVVMQLEEALRVSHAVGYT